MPLADWPLACKALAAVTSAALARGQSDAEEKVVLFKQRHPGRERRRQARRGHRYVIATFFAPATRAAERLSGTRSKGERERERAVFAPSLPHFCRPNVARPAVADRRSSPTPRPRSSRTDVYTIGKELGTGTFGVVRQVIQKQTGEHFALKTINKEKLDVRSQAICVCL